MRVTQILHSRNKPCRELKLRHVKLVREKKEMMASVSVTIATINNITIATITGCWVRGEMQGNDDVEVWSSC